MVDTKKAKQLNKQKRKQQKQAKHSGAKTESQEIKEAAASALKEKVEQDKARASELNKLEEQKQIAHQIKQLILSNKIDKGKVDTDYQFSDGKKIKKILVSATHHKQLVSGYLAVVALDEQYELVPAIIAEKIAQRDDSKVKVLNKSAATEENVVEDDPYADYQIPDDLMW